MPPQSMHEKYTKSLQITQNKNSYGTVVNYFQTDWQNAFSPMRISSELTLRSLRDTVPSIDAVTTRHEVVDESRTNFRPCWTPPGPRYTLHGNNIFKSLVDLIFYQIKLNMFTRHLSDLEEVNMWWINQNIYYVIHNSLVHTINNIMSSQSTNIMIIKLLYTVMICIHGRDSTHSSFGFEHD